MARRRTIIVPRIKPVNMQVHPEFFKIHEDLRKSLERQGAKSSQMNTTKILSKHIILPKGGIRIDVKKKKQTR